MATALVKLHYHRQRRILDLLDAAGQCRSLSAEFLRVHSPSAEVRGHGTPRLVANKRQVGISAITPVGRYAVKLQFDDGHHTGLYSFVYLQQLASQQETLWQQYLARLKAANASREPLITIKSL